MSYVDAAIARLKDEAERKVTTSPTREVGPWTYKRIPEEHGYLLDANGVIPPDVLKTIGECEYQHEAAMNVIAALLGSHATLTAQLAAAKADGERFHLLAVEVLSNGMIVGGIDVSEEACHEAVSHGRKEPIDDDRVMAARIAVDALRLLLESPPADAALAVQP